MYRVAYNAIEFDKVHAKRGCNGVLPTEYTPVDLKSLAFTMDLMVMFLGIRRLRDGNFGIVQPLTCVVVALSVSFYLYGF